MNFLISIHGIKNSPEAEFLIKMINQLDKSSEIDGFEINGDFKDEREMQFMMDFSKLMKEDSRTIQFHAPWNFSFNFKDLKYLNEAILFYDEISKILQREISIVLHPIEFPDETIAEMLTSKFLRTLSEIVKSNDCKIKFTLENLNRVNNSNRLSTQNVKYILNNFPEIGFCWDIGHEVSENICTYSLSDSLLKKLKNVHIHDVLSEDHLPFYYGNTDLKKSISYLMDSGYTGTIVTEINLGILKSSSLREKYKEYIENISFLKKYYIAALNKIEVASNK